MSQFSSTSNNMAHTFFTLVFFPFEVNSAFSMGEKSSVLNLIMQATITQDLTLALAFSNTVMRQTNTNISQCKICGAPALYS